MLSSFCRTLAQTALLLLLALPAGCAGFPLSILDSGPFEVQLRPDKTEWLEGEEITGTMIFRNSTGQTLTIDDTLIGEPTVRNAQGVIAERFEANLRIRHGREPQPRPMEIGRQDTLPFHINTDPLGYSAGSRIPPGEYTLQYEDPNKTIPAALSTVPVKVRVLARPGDRIGERIVRAFGAPDRILILRESGSLETYSALDGSFLSSTDVTKGQTPSTTWFDAKCSPDGHWAAAFCDHGDEKKAVRLYSLATNDPPRDFVWDGVMYFDYPSLDGFDQDSSTLRISDKLSREYNIATGAVTIIDTWKGAGSISPDGRHCRVFEGGPGHWQVSLKRRDGSTIPGDWDRNGHWLMTNEGIYGPSGTRRWTSYDGKTTREFPDAPLIPLAESPDGSLIAWESGNEFRLDEKKYYHLSIYTTKDQLRLWDFKDTQPHTAFFTTGQDPKLILTIGESGGTTNWLANRFLILNPRTGQLEQTLSLKTPTAPAAATAQPAK